MNEQSIFLAALDFADPAQRADYLNRTCDGEAALRERVEALLAAHERSGEFLDVPALKQVAAGNSGGETSAEHHAAQGETDLSFLQPSSTPGSLGRLGHYEVRQVIGRGGCGIVLKAFDEKLERIVAIKVMAPELAATSPARKRFLREARATAAIRHENVINIYAVEEQPLPFLVMEYIDGETLQQRLDRTGPLDVRDVLRIGQRIASGLAAAHDKGLIHRDIKPGNILLEHGTDHLKITDFGLARSVDDASMTQSGVIAGTPLYMSPEQAQAEDIDHRSDLFSLGSVLYVMCSGRPPFRAATSIAVLRRVVEEQPRPIQGIIPEVPGWLVAIIARLHAKNPAERFASAKEIGDLLARWRSELGQHGRGESLGDILPMLSQPEPTASVAVKDEPEHASPARAHKPRRWVAAAAVIVVLLAGLGMTEATGVTNVRGTVIRLFSPEGTLVVEVDDPGVSVTIDGEEMVITGAGAKEIRLKPGRYKVLASKDGNVVRQELVTVTTNGRQVVRVSKEAEPPAAIGSTDPDRRAAEWALSIGGRIRVNGQEDDIIAAEVLPKHAFELTSVDLGKNSQATDAALANFKGCKNLARLALNHTPTSDAGLVHFRDCKNLTYLNLGGTRAGDIGLGYFRDCKNLSSLDLRTTHLTDAGLANFKDCKELTYLSLARTRVTDAGLAHFKDCTKLTTLIVWETRITDRGLEHLKDCRNLTTMELFKTQVGDAGLEHLKDRKSLEALALHQTKVTAEGVKKLAAALPTCRIAWDGGVIEPTGSKLPRPTAALLALRRDQISPAALAYAGGGDADKAPPSLVAVLGEPEPIHTSAVKVLAFSPDGRCLASGGTEVFPMLRDAATGKVLRVLRGVHGHTGSIHALAFTPDSRTFISGDTNGTVKLWSTEDKQAPTTVELGVKQMQMAVSRDGRFLAAGGVGGEVKLWRWGQWDKPATLPVVSTGTLFTLAFSPDGEVLACGWIDNKLESPIGLYKTSDGSLQQTLPAHQQHVASLSFSPDGKYLASAGGGHAKLWDLTSAKATDLKIAAELVCFSPDGKKIAGTFQSGIHIYDVAAQATEKSYAVFYRAGPFGGGYSLAFSPDGKTLVVGNCDGAVNFYDTVNWEPITKVLQPGHRSSIVALAASPDGRVVLSRGSDPTVRRWSLEAPTSHQIVHQFKHPSNWIDYGPDGKTFAAHSLTVWDAATTEELFTVPVGLISLVYSPDGRTIAGFSYWDRTVRLWDVQFGKEVHRFPALKDRGAHSLAFSADGKLLAAISITGEAVVWNAATGAEAASWKDTPMASAAFHPDGSCLVTGHHNGTIVFWDTATWEKKRTLSASTGPVSALKFTPDGKTLLSSGTDGVIQVRNPEHERARAVIPVGPAGLPVVFDLDASGQYLFASGPTPVIYVHRLPLND